MAAFSLCRVECWCEIGSQFGRLRRLRFVFGWHIVNSALERTIAWMLHRHHKVDDRIRSRNVRATSGEAARAFA